MHIEATLSVPLRTNENGVVRVGRSRVRLETVVFAFNEGCTAEEIISRYPSLKLGEVYAVIAYYLDHRADVDGYMNEREEQREKMRLEIQAQPDYQAFRERLLKRKVEQRRDAST